MWHRVWMYGPSLAHSPRFGMGDRHRAIERAKHRIRDRDEDRNSWLYSVNDTNKISMNAVWPCIGNEFMGTQHQNPWPASFCQQATNQVKQQQQQQISQEETTTGQPTELVFFFDFVAFHNGSSLQFVFCSYKDP